MGQLPRRTDRRNYEGEGVKVLVACERSGVVRRAFAALGHDAWSCDLEPAEDGDPQHIQGDILEQLDVTAWNGWDLMIAHPPCTYLSRAGARWWKDAERQKKADDAAKFVLELWHAPVERIAIENPIGQLNQRWRYPDQTIQPHHFGDPYTKATCLWLKNLPILMSTMLCGDARPFLPSNTGGAKRGQKATQGVVSGGIDAARTFPGIAKAMAEQWGAVEEVSCVE